ncbi:Hypp5535 [Branchiostoma lanceolatum]|uniref:Hypp5535 protein n=2 Tax=Branchiostoma lanceolatum TaxID=7740 RepID=A0A8J9YS10_BRALA|nr:Hypp5535 [Branchiostoma lanceolatum]
MPTVQLKMLSVAVLLTVLSAAVQGQTYLSADGQHFKLNGQRVFLSGVNMAWCRYGSDFGGGLYYSYKSSSSCPSSKSKYEQAIQDIANNGGNSLRVWLHVEGQETPVFSYWGSVTQTDATDQLVNELKDMLGFAKRHNVLVFLVLWNGAHHGNNFWKVRDLVWDDLKLSTYVDEALKPLALGLRNERALGGWEIMNEPEGSLRVQHDSDPCYNTDFLAGSGAGWAGDADGTYLPMNRMLRFINRQIAGIKEVDPNHLVTVGSWSEKGQGIRNLYTDDCLQKAGDYSYRTGVLDFYQIHTYTKSGSYGSQSPFRVDHARDYTDLSGRPIVIGEFSQIRGGGMGITDQFNRAYYYGYGGAWSWHYSGGGDGSDSTATQMTGLRWLQNKNDQNKGGCVKINLNGGTNRCDGGRRARSHRQGQSFFSPRRLGLRN